MMRTEFRDGICFEGPRPFFRWCAVLIVSTIMLCDERQAAGRTDSAGWNAARTLAEQIQRPTPTLSENERNAFLARFADLSSQHDALESDEKDLIARLSGDRRDLNSQADATAAYQADRAGWQDRLNAYNRACARTFTDPADVARCDQSAAILARERQTLDATESNLVQQATALHARQTENVGLVGQLDSRYAQWNNNLEAQFNAPLRTALARSVGTSTLRLTVKSFISRLDIASMSAESRPRLERALAWISNTNFSEHPTTPSPDARDYRLWSQVVAVVSCRDDMVMSWKASNLAHRGGTELRILDAETSVMEPLTIIPPAPGNDDVKQIAISYAIKGKPNDAALPVFQVVKPRTCSSIWHRLRVTITCRSGVAQTDVKLGGSRFPSHRMWINDDAGGAIEQGPFSDLWNCDPSAPDLVQ